MYVINAYYRLVGCLPDPLKNGSKIFKKLENEKILVIHQLEVFVWQFFTYCRTHNVPVCLYIAYIASGSAKLYIKTLYFFICTFFMLAAATVTIIKIHYDAKTPQFAIFRTRVICVFYSITDMYIIYFITKVYLWQGCSGNCGINYNSQEVV